MPQQMPDEAETIFGKTIEPNPHLISVLPFENICTLYLRELYKNRINKPFTIFDEIGIYSTNSKKNLLGKCKFINELFDLVQPKKLPSKLSLKGGILDNLSFLVCFHRRRKRLSRRYPFQITFENDF